MLRQIRTLCFTSLLILFTLIVVGCGGSEPSNENEVAEASTSESTATETSVSEPEPTDVPSPTSVPTDTPSPTLEPTNTPSPTPEPTERPLPTPTEPLGAKVGLLLPLTGELGWVANAIPAIELAVEEINEAGGATGEPIIPLTRDTEGIAIQAIVGASELLDKEQVVAVIGPSSLTIRSVMPLVQKRGASGISPTAGTTALDKMSPAERENIYRTVSSDMVMGSGMAWYAANELEAKKVALFFADTPSASSVGGVLRTACEVLGLEIVADVSYIEERDSYREELETIQASASDVIFFEGGPVSSAVFFREKNELGLEGTWIGTDYVNDPFAEATGETGEDVMGVNPAPEINDRFEEWKAKLEERRGEVGVPAFSANAYDAMMLIALAMEAAGEPTREGVVGKLREVANPPGELVTSFAQGKQLLAEGKEIDYVGIAGAQDFNELGDVVTSLQAAVIQDGKLERIGTLTEAEIGETLQQVLELSK